MSDKPSTADVADKTETSVLQPLTPETLSRIQRGETPAQENQTQPEPGTL